MIESLRKLSMAVEKALGHVDAGRLSLNPDCGFAPGKDHDTPLGEAYAKLKNLAQVARLLRQRG
jgi:5-methyltetrahydropteroyltriglutamate--homocysteine methyltransferase